MADDLPIKVFTSQETWERWLERNHAKAEGIWLKLAKKGLAQANGLLPGGGRSRTLLRLDRWPDQGLDDDYLQRFTPRRARSNWSKSNLDRVTALIEQGRMRPPGLAEVERAKADGRWAAASLHRRGHGSAA